MSCNGILASKDNDEENPLSSDLSEDEPHHQFTVNTSDPIAALVDVSQRPSHVDQCRITSSNSTTSDLGVTSSLVLARMGTPERNLISQRVSKIDSDPYFAYHDEDTNRDVYKHIDPINIKVPSSEVRQVITFEADGSRAMFIHNFHQGDIYHSRSKMFRKWMVPSLPSHFSPTLTGHVTERKFSHAHARPGGRKAKSTFSVAVSGYCSAKENGCPTTFIAGFSEQQIKLLASQDISSHPEHLVMGLTFEGHCNHAHHKPYGQLRGPRRDDIISSSLDQKPGQISKHFGLVAEDTNFHTHNRLFGVPNRHMSSNLTRERKKKRKADDGLVHDSLSNLLNISHTLVSLWH